MGRPSILDIAARTMHLLSLSALCFLLLLSASALMPNQNRASSALRAQQTWGLQGGDKVWCENRGNTKECATNDGKLSPCDKGDCVFGGKQYGCVEKARVECTNFLKKLVGTKVG